MFYPKNKVNQTVILQKFCLHVLWGKQYILIIQNEGNNQLNLN